MSELPADLQAHIGLIQVAAQRDELQYQLEQAQIEAKCQEELADAYRQQLTQAQRERDEALAEVTRLWGLAYAGYHLSCYVAAINWGGRRNTQEYLLHLRHLIEEYQSAYHAETPDSAGEN